jgi:hypothetical protein
VSQQSRINLLPISTHLIAHDPVITCHALHKQYKSNTKLYVSFPKNVCFLPTGRPITYCRLGVEAKEHRTFVLCYCRTYSLLNKLSHVRSKDEATDRPTYRTVALYHYTKWSTLCADPIEKRMFL